MERKESELFRASAEGGIPSNEFLLPGGVVAIWRVSTLADPTLAQRFLSFLSPEEIERGQRFQFEHLRHAYHVTRGTLRILLAKYLGLPPASIRISAGPKGKPTLHESTPIHFNLSHTGSLAAFAFSRDCEVGIDVEEFRPLPDLREIAERFFCPEEAAEVQALPARLGMQAFFLCWTRKESYIKAIGEGLSLPLDSFRVSLTPGHPARFVHLNHDHSACTSWHLHNLELDENCAGALAYQGQSRQIRVMDWINPVELLKVL